MENILERTSGWTLIHNVILFLFYYTLSNKRPWYL
jgi:hypothetical protein